MRERDEIFLKGSATMFFQGLFIGCEPVWLTKMSEYLWGKLVLVLSCNTLNIKHRGLVTIELMFTCFCNPFNFYNSP